MAVYITKRVERRRERLGWLLRRVGGAGFVCDGSRPETNVTVNIRQPMELSEKVAPSGL